MSNTKNKFMIITYFGFYENVNWTKFYMDI